MGILCFQIHKIPDLSLNKYQSLADTGIEGVLKRHESFLRQWHGICHESATSFHLMYTYLPLEELGSRLKVYFILQGETDKLLMCEPLLNSSPLKDFYKFEVTSLPKTVFESGATLKKKERFADIYNPLVGQSSSFHYVPKWEMNDSARLYDLFQIMKTVSQAYTPAKPCAFRIDLYPSTIAEETRSAFDPILKTLRGENDIRLLNKSDGLKDNNYARDICREYEDWITSLETSPNFRVNMYGFADTLFKAKVILSATGSEALSKGDFSIVPIKPDPDGFYSELSRMGGNAEDYCSHSKQVSLQSWSTTYCLSEVIPFFRLPVLFDGESIEIPKETAPEKIVNGLYLGRDTHGYPVNFPLEDMPRHAFFTGMPGSGKTNTMLHLISQLRKRKIPFLALEPAKKEYRSLLGRIDMQDVFLFSPHMQSYFPLHMNPLEFPKGVRLSEHINALLEVFEGSFVLEGPTYKFLSSSIQASYEKLGWDIEDMNNEDCDLLFPNLQDIYDNLEYEIDKSSYDSEVKGNVRAFLQVRLGSLIERDAGELFNVRRSTLAPEEWIETSAIVELEVLSEQAKNFFVLLICHYILETLRSNPNGGLDHHGQKLPVRHVIFIEEAHNIIAPSSQQSNEVSVNPKISATAYIIKMLAEVRALRESIVIADQLPSMLASEVTKNTDLKLVHRLIAQDDRQQIGMAISASELQLEQMATFSSGRALIYHEKTQKPFEVQIEEWDAPEISYDITNDKQLYQQLFINNSMQRIITSSFQNWEEKFLYPIFKETTTLWERYAAASEDDLVEMICIKSEKELMIATCRKLKKRCCRMKDLWLFDFNRDIINTMFNKVFENIENMIDCLNKIHLKG